jgi:hypothetical protein
MNNAPDKAITIIVNARPRRVPSNEVSFEQVANLAFDNNPPSGPNIVITVMYRHGNEQGSLSPGQKVTVKGGTIFDVTATDKS